MTNLSNFILREAGLPEIRFHDLRHTAASLMLNHGIPLIIVSSRLGHARPSITLDIYGHLIPSMQAEAAQKIDDLVTPVELHLLVIILALLKFQIGRKPLNGYQMQP
jgi:integrase